MKNTEHVFFVGYEVVTPVVACYLHAGFLHAYFTILRHFPPKRRLAFNGPHCYIPADITRQCVCLCNYLLFI
jgi:hypothetical protein